MKNKYSIFISIMLLLVAAFACVDEYELNEMPPAAEDAQFTYAPTAENDNIIDFTASSGTFLMTWDLGNGVKGKGTSITGVYPTMGTYTVTLTAYTAGGSVSTSQEIFIEETDPTLLDKPLYNMLTGGVDATEGKTWVIDSARSGHFGVGPDPSSGAGDIPEYYAAGANEKTGGGMYDDRYTFYLADFQFDMETNGDVYINGSQGANFPGAEDPGVGDLRAPYDGPDGLTWTIAEPEGSYPELTISPGGFIGYYAGTSSYQIISIEENELFLRMVDQANAGLAWYLRLIPEGYDGGGEPEPDVLLPLDFESSEPAIGVFGGTGAGYVDNPDASGINTSGRVAEIVHGNETWAGLFFELSENIDLESNGLMSIKVWSPIETDVVMKLENLDNADINVEVSLPITTTNEWVEMVFDFTGSANDYGRIVLFPGYNTTDPNTFYLDDISQYAGESVPMTLSDLTGDGSKAWKLKPAAGAYGVGPAKGSDEWYPNGADISGDRPCLFNDLYIFKTGDEYEYDAQGDIFGEGYMGLADECQDEANLAGTDAASWGSGTHSFSFTQASGDTPGTITVTGTGAFIALPKAYNGGEYAAAPPATDGSVTYEIIDYKKSPSEELTISVDISGDGSGFWTFVLIPAE